MLSICILNNAYAQLWHCVIFYAHTQTAGLFFMRKLSENICYLGFIKKRRANAYYTYEYAEHMRLSYKFIEKLYFCLNFLPRPYVLLPGIVLLFLHAS